MNVLPASLSVYHIQAVSAEARRRHWISRELELQMGTPEVQATLWVLGMSQGPLQEESLPLMAKTSLQLPKIKS